jgi:hypothetical protein
MILRRRRAHAALAVAVAATPALASAGTISSWNSGVSGNWTDATKWSTNPVYPNGAGYDVVIGASASSTYYVSTGFSSNISVDSIALTSAFAALQNYNNLSATNGITLTAGSQLINQGQINNTSITGGSILSAGVDTYFSGGTLAGTTLDVQDNYSSNNVHLNNVTLSSAILNINDGGHGNVNRIYIDGGLSGSGEIRMNSAFTDAKNIVESFNPFSIASGIVIRTGTGGGAINRNLVAFTNNGTISAETADRGLDVYAVTNSGTLRAVSGSTLSLLGSWSNPSGSIIVNNGVLNLGGNNPLGALGNFSRTGGTVNVAGSVSNVGQTLDVSSTSAGAINLGNGAIINGGTVVASAGSAIVTAGAQATFNGVVLGANTDLSPAATLTSTGGLTIGASRTLSLAATPDGQANLFFSGSQTLDGGAIVFNSTVVNNTNSIGPSAGTLTIGSSTTIRTGTGNAWVGDYRGTVINKGTLVAATAGKTLTIGGESWMNLGTIRADAGTVALQGSFTTAAMGSIVRTGGSLAIAGALDNSNATLNLDTLGPVTLAAGRIAGGTIAGSNALSVPQSSTYDNGYYLDKVTIAAPVAATNYANLHSDGGFTLSNSTIAFGYGSTLSLYGTAPAINGTGTLSFDSSTTPNSYISMTGATLGSGVNVKTTGSASGLGSSSGVMMYASGATLNGTVSSEVAGRSIGISGYSGGFTNNGTIRGINGGSVSLEYLANKGAITQDAGTLWISGMTSNTGTISTTNATLIIGANYSSPPSTPLSALRNVSRSGGSLIVSSTLEGTGATLDFGAGLGSPNLQGTLNRGTYLGTGGQRITVNQSSAQLTGTTLQLPLDLSNSQQVVVRSGLTLANSPLTITSSANSSQLNFWGTQTLGGNGTVTFDGQTSTIGVAASDPFNSPSTPRTLTIAPGITFKTGTGSGFFNFFAGNINSAGTFTADRAGAGFTFSGGTLANSGSITASNNASLVLSALVQNSGTIAVSGATLGMAGTVSGSGSFSVSNSRINLGRTFTPSEILSLPLTSNTLALKSGTIDATGTSFDLSPATGSLIWADGTLKGGRFSASGGTQYILSSQGNIRIDGGTIATNLSVPDQTSISSVISGTTLDNADIALNAGAGASQIIFYNDQTLAGAGTVTYNGTSNLGTLIPFSGTMTIGPQITVRTGTQGGRVGDYLNKQFNLVNKGTISAKTAGRTITLYGKTFTNSGTLSATNAGTISLDGTVAFSNYANSSTLSGGTYSIGAGSSMLFGSRNISTNNADVTLDGSGANFPVIAPLASNGGSFTITSGRNFTTVGNLANSGTLRVGKDTTLTVNGTLTNTGKIKGKGTIRASVISSGYIQPGDSPGALTIDGTLTQNAAGILEMEIAGASAGTEYDQLAVTGSATFNGTLNVLLTNGFVPQENQVFTLFTAPNAALNFSTINLPVLPNGMQWNSSSFLATGSLATTPEPSSLMLLLPLALPGRRRRRAARHPLA